MDVQNKQLPVLIIGNGKLSYSVCVCLLQAQHPVTLVTENKEEAFNSINAHFEYLTKANLKEPQWSFLEIISTVDSKAGYKIGIAITNESLTEKKSAIQLLEKALCPESVIAINTENISIKTLQETCDHPQRLIGMNWVEPAHITHFLEVIINANTNQELARKIFSFAKKHWNKDPYLISNDVSIRTKLFSAMAREAFYLVKNGYASIEDIDRACRNDAGYYLPFSGNFRYMDLMGTYAYGLVMKDLNRELSKDSKLPDFIDTIIREGGSGMENNNGFYKYEEEDVKYWNETFAKFSYQVQHIIEKYPFNYEDKTLTADKHID